MKKLIFCFLFLFVVGLILAQDKTTIYFESGKSDLTPDAKKILDAIVPDLSSTKLSQEALSTGKLHSVQLNGYCDNVGSDISNQLLSEKRISAVGNYLSNKKNPFFVFTPMGFGETNPVASNDNEKGKAKNRRVEIVVTSLEGKNIKDEVITEKPVVPEPQNTFNEKSTLTDLEVGKTLVLKNLNFEGGTAVLLPEAKPTLEMLLRTMQENPALVIEIGGHVCCKNDMPLSIERAETVYKYLVKNGINKDRMTYKGYSRSKPIVEDDRDEYNARLNRRVEITVIKK